MERKIKIFTKHKVFYFRFFTPYVIYREIVLSIVMILLKASLGFSNVARVVSIVARVELIVVKVLLNGVKSLYLYIYNKFIYIKNISFNSMFFFISI